MPLCHQTTAALGEFALGEDEESPVVGAGPEPPEGVLRDAVHPVGKIFSGRLGDVIVGNAGEPDAVKAAVGGNPDRSAVRVERAHLDVGEAVAWGRGVGAEKFHIAASGESSQAVHSAAPQRAVWGADERGDIHSFGDIFVQGDERVVGLERGDGRAVVGAEPQIAVPVDAGGPDYIVGDAAGVAKVVTEGFQKGAVSRKGEKAVVRARYKAAAGEIEKILHRNARQKGTELSGSGVKEEKSLFAAYVEATGEGVGVIPGDFTPACRGWG